MVSGAWVLTSSYKDYKIVRLIFRQFLLDQGREHFQSFDEQFVAPIRQVVFQHVDGLVDDGDLLKADGFISAFDLFFGELFSF